MSLLFDNLPAEVRRVLLDALAWQKAEGHDMAKAQMVLIRSSKHLSDWLKGQERILENMNRQARQLPKAKRRVADRACPQLYIIEEGVTPRIVRCLHGVREGVFCKVCGHNVKIKTPPTPTSIDAS